MPAVDALVGTACRGLLHYCSSLVTSCCTLLAWARAEMPVWLRISYLDMLEVAVRVVRGLHCVLRRHDVLLLRAEHGADRVQRVDLRADVAVLRRNVGDGPVESGQRRLGVGLVGQIGTVQCLPGRSV